MEIIIISATALAASLLTFFSGFGLGTILTPVMVVFFPVELSIALTGIVHLLNNLFKLALTWRHIDFSVSWRFGITAVLGASLGAWALLQFPEQNVLAVWHWQEKVFEIKQLKLGIAALMIFFALFEMLPFFKKIQFDRNKLPLGGLLSGFFGGFSGHQGALRSAFLLRCGLTKESFIATGIILACFIDFTRLGIYAGSMADFQLSDNWQLLTAAIASAFAGAYAGSKLLPRITYEKIQLAVSLLIFLLAILLGLGII